MIAPTAVEALNEWASSLQRKSFFAFTSACHYVAYIMMKTDYATTVKPIFHIYEVNSRLVARSYNVGHINAIRLFWKAHHVFDVRRTKRITKFDGLEPRHCEDMNGIVAPEIGPKSFGTFEKQAPGGRFSKDPVTYRARKVRLKTMIRLPWKPALIICFR